MAHKFQGRWRSFVIDDFSKSGRQDGEIYLRINEANGAVLPGSNHDGKTVTGSATMAGNRLDLRQEDGGNIRVQFGVLVSEEDLNGNQSLVIVGRYKDTTRITPPEIAESSKDDAEARQEFVTAGQEEGGWVATKP